MGHQLSNLLWRTLPRAKSAGRVQSVALKLICDREIEREIFKPQEYWTIKGLFKNNIDNIFEAFLSIIDGNKIKKFDINSKSIADSALKK